ncbi:hypothetical protein [Alishewanella longhuensis]
MTKTIFCISLLLGLCLATPTLARNVDKSVYCQMQVTAAVMGSGIWYQMGYPFNLSANNLGLIPGTTAYQLTELAYQLHQQRLPQSAITQQVQQRCSGFSVSELAAEHSFFAENGNTPVELTVCGDVTILVVQSFSLLEGQPVSVDALLTLMQGEQALPGLPQLTEFAVGLLQQQQVETAILEQVFSYCQQQSTEFKQQLARGYYAH